MDTQRTCPSCGKALAADAPQGICPECLMKAGFGTASGSEGGGNGSFVPPPVEAIARLFPQLEILELIGRGGMGAVYKARQPGLDRLVALKILPPRTGSDPGFAERFTREARALAKLSHPNIVGVYDFGQVSNAGVSPANAAGIPPASGGGSLPPITNLHYFLMEYVDGPNLRQVERAGKLSPPQALQIIPQICEALQYAHDEGIVHRDIKPENVLLDKKGRVKIADFGLAKILGREPQDFRLTGAGQIMGTPNYMAPEQVEHPQEVDHRADIYSLGVVFYEMLTGDLPLGKFAPPSRKVQVDVRLDEVVMHALENEPERRYQHASQIKSDVETIVNSGSAAVPAALSGSRPTEAAQSVSSQPTSRPWALIVVAALLIASGCSTAWQIGHDLPRHIYNFNFGVLALPIGIGLLRRRPWWRIAALASLWFCFALIIVSAGLTLTGHMLLNATVNWMGREVTGPRRIWIGLLCYTLGVALLVWMYRVLVRPDVKALFQRGPFARPWIEWGALVAALALALTAGSGSTPSPRPREMRILQHFTAADQPLSGELTLTEDNAWAATCTTTQTFRLFEVPNPDVEQRTVIYRAQLKTEGLVGRAYLEMWCQLPGRGEFFSRGLDNTISGSTDWATCQTPFFLKAGEEPDLIRLNLVVEGRGKVFIKDVELLAARSN